LTIPF